jgi:membrane fusion protein (multidrug efflux system)
MTRFIFGLILVLTFFAILAGIFRFKAFVNSKIAYAISHLPPPVVTVSSAKVSNVKWEHTISAVASLNAVQGVNVTAQIAGNVTGIYFHSGEKITAGQRLVQVDNSTQLAQLRADEANESLAEINVNRTRKLIAHQAASQSQLDTYVATLANIKAVVGQDKATLAKLDITAPFSGYLGIRQVSLGQYLSPGTAVVTINKWNPIYADFNIPQNEFSELKVGRRVSLSVDAYPHHVFKGKIEAISSNVDTNSRTIQVQAEFKNRHLLLRPGMFGEVTVHTGKVNSYVAVPDTAVTYNTYGDYVYLIISKPAGAAAADAPKNAKYEKIVKQVPVVVGSQRDHMVAVLSGLKPGQTVVTAGQIKLHPGAVVKINNTIKP